MADELVFTVDGAYAVPAQEVTLSNAGLLERQHLQQWVVDYPEFIGLGVKVVAFEYGRWISSSGAATADRLDVLGLDRTGRPVVVELKRDRAPDTVTMQAINYAAMVRRFSLDTLAEVHAAHLGGDTSADEARSQLTEWAEGISDETLGPSRIVLMAADVGPTVTNTALFLYEAGIDIRLVRYQPYQTAAGQKVLTVTQLLPVPDAEEFMVRPRSSASTQAASRAAGERRAAAVNRLVSHGVIADGTPLTTTVPDQVGQDREAIRAWLDADPNRRTQVRWYNDVDAPVEWADDGRRYRILPLIRHIIETVVGAAAGLALAGSEAIVEIRFADFVTLAFDPIVNVAAKSTAMSGRPVQVPLVVRCPTGGNRGYGPTHSQSLQKHFLGVPGLSVHELTPFHDPITVLAPLLDAGAPALLFEDKVLYTTPVCADGQADDLFRFTLAGPPPGVAHVFLERPDEPVDCVLVTPGGTAHRALAAMRSLLLEDELLCHLLVPSRLYPVDPLPLPSHAPAACVAEESTVGGTWGAEVAQVIHSERWGRLRQPVRLVCSADRVVPAAPHLERSVLVQAETIRRAVQEVCGD